MSEQLEGTNANQEASAENVEVLEEAGNLPSMKDEASANLDKFKMDDDFTAKNFKNGKLYGRFDSMEAVLNTLHAVETKYSNVMRDAKNGEASVAQQQSISEVATPVINKYIDNGFNYDGMDAEIAELAEASGKSVSEIKLHAIEIKEKISAAYDTVGGKEEYVAMQTWANENLSEADQKSYTADLSTGMSKYAIKGLHAEYRAAIGGENQEPQSRIEGDGNGKQGIRPYTSMAEISRDRHYLTGKGKMDSGAKAMHQRRMSITPDSTIYGR